MTATTTKLALILAGALALISTGCELGTEDELLEDELGQIDQKLCSKNCGGWLNGVRQAAWNSVAGDGFKPYRLAQYGAGSSYGPYSLCERRWSGRDRDGSTWISNACVVREGWIRWASNDYTNGTLRTLRTEVFLKMLQVVGNPGQHYIDYISGDPNKISSYYDITCQAGKEGNWGLAPHALDNSWSYADMERVTGGLILMLNAKDVHVEVALRTPGLAPPSEQPNPGQFYYEEAIAFGNVFKSKITAIAGGYHAHNPLLHARYSEMNVDSAKDVFLYDEAGCTYSAGPTNNLRVSSGCKDHDGNVWNHPVSARLRYMDPSWTLHGTVTVTKPGGGYKTVSM